MPDETTRPTKDALEEARKDARLWGTGFVMVYPDGRRARISPEEISPDSAEWQAAKGAENAKD